MRRRIAESLRRFVDPPLTSSLDRARSIRIEEKRREEKRKDTGLVARFASRNLPSSFLQTNIFLFIVSYASVKSSARRNTKCHLLGNIMGLLSRFHLSPPPPPLAHWSLPAALHVGNARGHTRVCYWNGIPNIRAMPIPKSERHHADSASVEWYIPAGRGRGWKVKVSKRAGMNGARNRPHVGRWSSREEERGDGDKRGDSRKGNVNEGCHCFLGCQNPRRPIPRPVTRISPLCAHRAFLLSPDAGNNRREIGDRQRHFVADCGARAAVRTRPLSRRAFDIRWPVPGHMPSFNNFQLV